MPFFTDLLRASPIDDEAAPVFAVFTTNDMATLTEMLGELPKETAAPILAALFDLSVRQRKAGLTPALERVYKAHHTLAAAENVDGTWH